MILENYISSLCTFLYPFMSSLVDTEVAMYFSAELKVNCNLHAVVECKTC